MKQIEIADVIVRRATPDDAAEIANVHLNSWREAYRNLLPQDYLDQLPLTFKARMKTWKRISTQADSGLFVAESKSGIVGFCGVSHPRESSLKEYGEIGAIYMLEKFHGKGIGAALLKMGMQQIIDWNYTKAYCWVLKDNPTIKFYEKSGAVFNGMVRDDDVAGTLYKDLVYEWKNLDAFMIGEREQVAAPRN